MRIIEITSDNVSLWEDKIFPLVKETVIYNFPQATIEEEYYTEKWKEVHHFLMEHKAYVYIAVDDNKVAGWLWCHKIQRFDQCRLHIAFISVYPEYKRCGVGNLLIKEAENKAIELGLCGIELFVSTVNEGGMKFYEKNSFEVERVLMYKDV